MKLWVRFLLRRMAIRASYFVDIRATRTAADVWLLMLISDMILPLITFVQIHPVVIFPLIAEQIFWVIFFKIEKKVCLSSLQVFYGPIIRVSGEIQTKPSRYKYENHGRLDRTSKTSWFAIIASSLQKGKKRKVVLGMQWAFLHFGWTLFRTIGAI